MKTKEIPQELLDNLYVDLETGRLRWIKPPGRKAKKGWFEPCINSLGYRLLGFRNRKYAVHRVIYTYAYGRIPDGMQVDHISGNRSDNRISNLRLATRAQNSQNQGAKCNNTSGFKGVYASGHRFRAKIVCNGSRKHLGTFDTAEEAYYAYCVAAAILHRDFAKFE